MKKIILFLVAGIGFSCSAQRISYFVSFGNLAHHEAEVNLVVSELQTNTPVFRMSRSSPGRYATHEFGKNVYDVRAYDEKGSSIAVTQVDGDVYEVQHVQGYVRLTYTVYGNYADGTYLGIDPSGIHINMPAMFMWMKGADKTPISIHFDVPQKLHWTIATQLKPTADSATFTAPGLNYFMDCPVKIGPLVYRNWDVKNPDGKTYGFRIAFDAGGSDSLFTAFGEKIERIVHEEQAVFGEVPAYDYGAYTFLASINPYVHGDGMEHRNSTMISMPVAFKGDDFLLEVFAHEFFHCWNVKRIRPKSLEPFNFEKSNMSDELWFAEGFTQYYGQLTDVRAGFASDTGFASAITSLVNTKEISPGARFYSPIDASRHAMFTDAGVSIDKTNYPNMFTSYYPYGASIALALDLTLRENYNKTLDDLMQAAWKRFGKPEIPYTVDGIRDVLASVTNDKPFADSFFIKYIYGHESIDYRPLLEKAGFIVKKASPRNAWIGNVRFQEKNGLVISSNTLRTSPLYEAGLDIDDKIIKLGDSAVTSQKSLAAVLAGLKPGDRVPISWQHHDETKTAIITIQENPAWTVVTFEHEGLPAAAEALEFRKKWLGSQVK